MDPKTSTPAKKNGDQSLPELKTPQQGSGVAIGRGRGAIPNYSPTVMDSSRENWDEEISNDGNSFKSNQSTGNQNKKHYRGERRGSQEEKDGRNRSNDRTDSGHRERSRERKDSDSNDHERRPSRDRHSGRHSTSQERKHSHNSSNYSNDSSAYSDRSQSSFSSDHGHSRGGHSHWSPANNQQHHRSPRGQHQRRSQQQNWNQRFQGPQSPVSPDGYYNNQSYGSQYGDGRTPPQGWQSDRRQDDPTVFLSRTLSSLLRHNAERFGFKLMPGGFLYVDEILHKTHKLRGFTLEDVKYVVDSNDKQRFTIVQEGERWKIRANQGHSLQVDNLELTPITSADQAPVVIHGTYLKAWDLIKQSGLCRMNRNHIHFAVGEPGENEVISGMRSSCEVIIYINVEKALADGLKLFRSANNVILSPGNDQGYIPPCYFEGVLNRKHRHKLDYDVTIGTEKSPITIPGVSGETKKSKKRKNKGAKTSELHTDSVTSDESANPSPKKHCDMSSPESGAFQRSPSNERPVKDESPKAPSWNLPNLVKDVQESEQVVNTTMECIPDHITVVCCGEKLGVADGSIRALVLLAHPDIFVYHLHADNKGLVKEGKLDTLLKSKIPKVFHNLEDVAPSLIREYGILLDGIPIWDIQMLYDKVCLPAMDKEELKMNYKFEPKTFKQWAIENEDFGKRLDNPDIDTEALDGMVTRGKLIDTMFDMCLGKASENDRKSLKKDIYAAAIPSQPADEELSKKIKELKLERKEAQKKGKQDEKSKPAENQSTDKDNQSAGKSGSQQPNKGQSKKKNKKK